MATQIKRNLGCGCGCAGVGVLILLMAILLLGPAACGLNAPAASAATGIPGVVCFTPGSSPDVGEWKADQVALAAEIVAEGRQRGLPQRAWVIAVATAMAESSLQNLAYGDTAGPDSRGLFQQRDSWGPQSVRMNPRGSAGLFYDRLVKVPNYLTEPLGSVAQDVQISGRPDRYAGFEPGANAVVAAVADIRCQEQPGDNYGEIVVQAALQQIGITYAWGGGTAAGPSKGISDNGGEADRHGDYNKIGFDCSGLALYAYAKIGVGVPHQTQIMWNQFQPAITDINALQRGDLLMLGTDKSTSKVHHVGIYLGGGSVVEAPFSGAQVRVVDNIWAPASNYAREFVGALRPRPHQ